MADNKQTQLQQTIAQQEAKLAQSGQLSGGNLYIGVGNTYTVPYYVPPTQGDPNDPDVAMLTAQASAFNQPQAPRYKTGQDATILSQMSPDEIYDLQLGLNQAGMLDSFAPHQLDQSTRNAFIQILTEANITGKPWTQVLGEHVANPILKTKQGTQERPPLVINLTNPDDIRASFTTVARSLLGEKPQEADVLRFIANYQAQERSAQEQQYAATYAAPGGQNYYGAGGTITNAPGAQGMQQQAEDVTRAEHPNEVFVNTLNNLLGTMSNALLGGMPGGASSGTTA